MKLYTIFLSLLLSINLYAAKVERIETYKSAALSKIHKVAKPLKKLTADGDVDIAVWGIKIKSRRSHESTSSILKKTLRKAYTSYNPYSGPNRGIMAERLFTKKDIRKNFKNISNGLDIHFDIYKYENSTGKNINKQIQKLKKVFIQNSSRLKYYKTIHVSDFGGATGISIVDVKTKEVMFYELVWVE